MSENELARRLGYANAGLVSRVCNGTRPLPTDKAPLWADALGLTGDDRERFLDAAAEATIPAWYRQRVAEAREQRKALEDELRRCEQERDRRARRRP